MAPQNSQPDSGTPIEDRKSIGKEIPGKAHDRSQIEKRPLRCSLKAILPLSFLAPRVVTVPPEDPAY